MYINLAIMKRMEDLVESYPMANDLANNLCNVIYKVISKVMVNRLKKILLDIISPNQSVIILGRLIFNNILVAYETLHTISAQIKSKSCYVARKLDMSKTYNQVE